MIYSIRLNIQYPRQVKRRQQLSTYISSLLGACIPSTSVYHIVSFVHVLSEGKTPSANTCCSTRNLLQYSMLYFCVRSFPFAYLEETSLKDKALTKNLWPLVLVVSTTRCHSRGFYLAVRDALAERITLGLADGCVQADLASNRLQNPMLG